MQNKQFVQTTMQNKKCVDKFLKSVSAPLLRSEGKFVCTNIKYKKHSILITDVRSKLLYNKLDMLYYLCITGSLSYRTQSGNRITRT